MITVVIADRMGKGQNVAKGVEAAGGRAAAAPCRPPAPIPTCPGQMYP